MILNSTTYLASLESVYKYITVRDSSILITGATGLIGSCLVDAFCLKNKEQNANNKIFALGRNLNKLEERFNKHQSHRPSYIKEDIAEYEIPDNYEFDFIIHAASNADPGRYSTYPVETILTNTKGTEHVLEYCKHNQKCKVILLSTFEVYGKHDADEYSEDDFGLLNQNSLRSGYPESKRVAELLVRSYHAEYGVNGLIARLPSVYGPTMMATDNKAHAEFLRSGTWNKDIIMKSSGTQRRTYCYVIDVINGILKILFEGSIGESYNISNPLSVVSIKEFADIVAQISGVNVRYSENVDINLKWNVPVQNCILKSDKLQKLGWQAEYDIQRGIKETLQIMAESLAIPNI